MNRINYSKLVSMLVILALLFSAFSSFVFADCSGSGTVDYGGKIYFQVDSTTNFSCLGSNNYRFDSLTSPPSCGTVTNEGYIDLPGGGNHPHYYISYTHNPSASCACGSDTFVFRTNNPSGSTWNTQNVTVNINIINCPHAYTDTADVCTNSCVNVSVLDNDDNKGASPTINFVSTPTGGTAEISGGKINYCAPSTPGTYEFNYTFTDGTVTSNKAEVTVTVFDCSNPSCTGSGTVDYGDYIDFEVDSNDDFSCLSNSNTYRFYQLLDGPDCGTAVSRNSGKDVRYTPTGCCGTDSFTFMARRGASGSYEYVVVGANITINCTLDCSNSFIVDYGDSLILEVDGTSDFSCLPRDDEDEYRFYQLLDDANCGKVTSINSGQDINYTPTGCCGTDTFTFRAREYDTEDHEWENNYKIVRANITINCAPDCEHSFSVNCDSYKNIDFDLISCISANSNHYQSHTNPSYGSVSVISNRMIRYTPVSGYSGPDSFTFTAGGNTVQVNVTVTCNSPPIPDCTYYVDYNCATGDIIVDGTTYDYINVNDAARVCYPTANYKGSVFLVNPNPGTAVFVGDGNQIDYSLTNCNGYCGQTDTLTFLADKVGAGGDIPDPITIKVILTIICPNRPPTAFDDSDTTNEDTCVDVNVTTNDTDPDNDSLTVLNFTDPAHGSVTDEGSGVLRYCPDDNWCGGTDTFDYNVSDGNGGTDIGTVSITVNCTNDPPTAFDDSDTTNEDTCVDVNVTTNDTDPDNDSLTVLNFTDPAHGSVTDEGSGVLRYCPDDNWCGGTDTFDYNVSDGNGGTDIGTVSITVNCTNDPPTAFDDSDTTNEDTCVDVNVTTNDTDPDNDSLTVLNFTDPAHGSVTDEGSGVLRYCPDDNWCGGTDTFDYNVSDGNGGTDIGTVSITVNCTNDPPTAFDDSDTTNEDTCVDVNVTTNDTDPDNDSLTVLNFTDPAHGSVTDEGSGVLRYCPDDNWCGGTDTFDYNVSDGNGGTDIGTVSITVNCTNDPPTAFDDSDTTNEDTCVDVNVTTNDTDPDNDSLTVLNFTDPAHGSVTDEGSGVLRYCPDDNWCGGTDTFDYNVSDGNGGTDIGTVSITIFCAENDPPIANDDETTTDEDTCIDVNVTKNDTDPENDVLTIQSFTDPQNGTIENLGGVFRYCPNLNYCGDDTFEYNVSDGQYTDKATVTIHVLCENDPPIANDDYNTTDSTTCIIIDVLANDIDPESNPLSASLVTEPAHGSLRFLGDTVGWEYCPDGNFCGIDTFTYVAYDGQLQSNIATVSIEIPCEEPILPNEKVPAALLYPLVDIERLTLTQGPVPIDGSIGAILDTGTNIIVDGKVIAVLEVTSGSRSLVAQVDNLGFVTQNAVRIRFDGLPQGVSVTFLPESQQIKAHNVGTYIVTMTVSDNAPKGSYFVTAKAFTRSGTLDSEIFNLVIN